MNKKVIIDLNGVVFEPVDRNFSEVARADYGRAKGAALTLAYKYGLGRRLMATDIADVLYKCAKNPTVRPGAIEALDALSRMPGVTIEFCGQMAFPDQAYKLEQKYRAIAPCMNAAAHYELISPFASKRGYLCSSTAADENAMNFILGTRARDLDWPARWRILPVLIEGCAAEANIQRHCHPRIFRSLHDFQDFLSRRR